MLPPRSSTEKHEGLQVKIVPGTFQDRIFSTTELPSNHQENPEELESCLHSNCIIRFELIYMTVPLHLAFFQTAMQ